MASQEQSQKINGNGSKRSKAVAKSVTTITTANTTKKPDDDDTRYCEFCGKNLNDLFSPHVLLRRKYCSERCRSIATNRLASARLGIPPARRAVSKLSNPLYFN
jgi:endogenous inhibitor of DNA gyrase (YacG/DUF329 family)